MKSSSVDTRVLAEMAVATALAAVLGLFKLKLPHLLYGGSISLHALPILVVAIRHGVRRGIMVGAAYSAVNFALGPFFLHPLQLLLDYPLAFGALGIAGTRISSVGTNTSVRASMAVAIRVVLASFLRFGMHFASGILYFAHLAPEGTPVWQFSLLYNASYLLPETIICVIALQVPLIRPLLSSPATRHPPC
jgi:thiamine transporter